MEREKEEVRIWNENLRLSGRGCLYIAEDKEEEKRGRKKGIGGGRRIIERCREDRKDRG